jgi:hypothetical protein
MADKMRYRCGPKVLIEIKKTGTVAISVGDILKRVGSNGRVMRISTSTDATAVVGIAVKGSPTTDSTATKILMLATGFGTIFEFDLASGSTTKAFKFGQMFKLTSSQPQQLTKTGTASSDPWTNSSSSNSVAICAREMEASGSTVQVIFKPNKWTGRAVSGKTYSSGTIGV